MYRSRSVSLALVGLFIWVTGCQTYTQIEIGEVADHGKVRVTKTDGERETLRAPRVEADSIKGLGKKVGVGISDRLPLAIPLDSVHELEAVGTNAAGTVLFVIGVVVGSVVAIWAIGCAASGEDSYACW